jgi:6-phosphogluconolactonase
MRTIIQLAGAFVVTIALTFTSCKKDENAPQPSSQNEEMTADRSAVQTGYVYTESNSRDGNAVFVYVQQRDGSLKFHSAAKTGGIGNGADLGSQGAVILNQFHTWLYAVNSGDGTISAFRIEGDGSLTLKANVSSMGIGPVSLATHRNLLYVVNAGSDNIQGFYTGADFDKAALIPIAGSSQKLSTQGAGAAQISFSPDGSHLFVTEKMTNSISSFKVDESGVAHTGFVNPALGKTPFGFAFSQNVMVVSNASEGSPEASTVTSYVGANTGTLKPISDPLATKQTAACWVTTTRGGRYVYVTNTGSNTISALLVGEFGRLQLLYPNMPGGLAPTDIVLDASNRFAYVISSGDHKIRQFIRTSDGFLKSLIPNDGMIGLPEAASGLATFTPGIRDANVTMK